MQFSTAVVFSFFVVASAKDLHIKEGITEKYSELKELPDILNFNENLFNDKERYARHVELVTESVLEHLLNEINKKYPSKKNESGPVPNMMRRMKMKLKKRLSIKKKNKKHKKKSASKNETNMHSSSKQPT